MVQSGTGKQYGKSFISHYIHAIHILLVFLFQLLEDEVDHISIRGDGDVFNITKSRLSDAGNYICAASNVEGTSNKVFERFNIPVIGKQN